MKTRKEMYNIYSIDICFESYAYGMDEVLVGAKSKKDLIAHIKDVFPDEEYEIQEYDVGEDGEYPNNKVGDIVKVPQYTKKQFREICKSNGMYSRIKYKPHLFTDTPYVVLDIKYYME